MFLFLYYWTPILAPSRQRVFYYMMRMNQKKIIINFFCFSNLKHSKINYFTVSFFFNINYLVSVFFALIFRIFCEALSRVGSKQFHFRDTAKKIAREKNIAFFQCLAHILIYFSWLIAILA